MERELKEALRSVVQVLIWDFRTLYNHVILDHRQCPLFIEPNCATLHVGLICVTFCLLSVHRLSGLDQKS